MEHEQESMLILAGRVLRFATEHPYAATGIFGAAVGSAVTYKVMTSAPGRPSVTQVFTPKVYEFALTPEDLRRMATDPTTEIRLETSEITLVIVPEKREPIKELPVIEG